MKKLYANGCSFTWGGDLIKCLHDDEKLMNGTCDTELNKWRLSVTWPKHLSDLLLCTEFHNDGLGCSSNYRIVRKTLDFFLPKISNKEDMSEWLAVIQWSAPARFEYFSDYYKCWTIVNHNMTIRERDIPNFPSSDNMDEVDKQFLEIYYKTFTEKFWTLMWFQQINMLGMFFEKYKINYLFTSMANPMAYLDETYKDFITHFNWYGGDDTRLYNISAMNIDMTSHPTLTGHKQIAERFYDYITKKEVVVPYLNEHI
jgi:hypothetical protein